MGSIGQYCHPRAATLVSVLALFIWQTVAAIPVLAEAGSSDELRAALGLLEEAAKELGASPIEIVQLGLERAREAKRRADAEITTQEAQTIKRSDNDYGLNSSPPAGEPSNPSIAPITDAPRVVGPDSSHHDEKQPAHDEIFGDDFGLKSLFNEDAEHETTSPSTDSPDQIKAVPSLLGDEHDSSIKPPAHDDHVQAASSASQHAHESIPKPSARENQAQDGSDSKPVIQEEDESHARTAETQEQHLRPSEQREESSTEAPAVQDEAQQSFAPESAVHEDDRAQNEPTTEKDEAEEEIVHHDHHHHEQALESVPQEDHKPEQSSEHDDDDFGLRDLFHENTTVVGDNSNHQSAPEQAQPEMRPSLNDNDANSKSSAHEHELMVEPAGEGGFEHGDPAGHPPLPGDHVNGDDHELEPPSRLNDAMGSSTPSPAIEPSAASHDEQQAHSEPSPAAEKSASDDEHEKSPLNEAFHGVGPGDEFKQEALTSEQSPPHHVVSHQLDEIPPVAPESLHTTESSTSNSNDQVQPDAAPVTATPVSPMHRDDESPLAPLAGPSTDSRDQLQPEAVPAPATPIHRDDEIAPEPMRLPIAPGGTSLPPSPESPIDGASNGQPSGNGQAAHPIEQNFEDNFIDHSDPYNPQQVHVQRKIESHVGPNGAVSHVQAETRTSSSLTNGGPQQTKHHHFHRSSSHSSSSYSASSSSTGAGTPPPQPPRRHRYTQRPSVRVPQIHAMPRPIQPLPSPVVLMPYVPFGAPSGWPAMYPDPRHFAPPSTPYAAAFAGAQAAAPFYGNGYPPFDFGKQARKQAKNAKKRAKKAMRQAEKIAHGFQ